ncbi:hypothetical protein [Halobellus inordinatus]|uniref:hypothetical protein n=1 Tax=Halobellus inordinatus TaxID=1126236 RepID=UPI002115B18D|nr:hypothetical protein [Halobellus ramosii]
MSKDVEVPAQTDSEESSEEGIRKELYDQFDISWFGELVIEYILPILERGHRTESRYNINDRPKILAEIALCQAYKQEPKFKILVWGGILIGSFDFLHTLNPSVYSILFIALATVNGFVSSLRSPSMMVAELEGLADEDGMPANYRAKAFSSVNTNITLVLFLIAVSIQILISGGFVRGEVLANNIADGAVNPIVTAGILVFAPKIYYWIQESE